jgi:hypothetical protein
MVEAVSRSGSSLFIAFFLFGLISFSSLSFRVRVFPRLPLPSPAAFSFSVQPTLRRPSPCFLCPCHHTHNYFFVTVAHRCSPLVMFLYHYLVARCFAVTFVCPIPGTAEGLLPRLAFGSVTKTAWMLYLSFGASIHSAEGPYVIRHSICVSSYQKLIRFLLISRLDITVICGLHKANPNALSSTKHGSEDA